MTPRPKAEDSLVLIVDDQDAGRFVKSQILRRAGFRVIEAATGRDAIAAAGRELPDLVVLDVNLPDTSGFEVAKILKQDPARPVIQILQVSNTATTAADRVHSLSAGADAYLAEPIDPDVFVATINALLRVRRVETELAAALERERAARQEAETANRLKDEFLAGLSHELRTPMNAIMGWIWQLRHSTLTEAGRERALASLERNTKLQTQLITDLLDISRIGKGKMQLEMRVLDVSSVVEAAAETAQQLLNSKKIDLQLKLTSAPVCGDALRLQQVVTNLLTNAVQFTPPEGRVTVSTDSDREGRVVIRVDDTGVGIDPEFLPHVFEKFRQAEGGLSRSHGGLGVGLTITKEIVELHDGSVIVTSEGRGRGTSVSVVLPKATPAAESLQSRCPDQPILTGITILVVDDDPDESADVTARLECSGACVELALSTDDALSLLRSRSVELVLTPRPISPLTDVPAVAFGATLTSDSTADPAAPGLTRRRRSLTDGALIRAVAEAIIGSRVA